MPVFNLDTEAVSSAASSISSLASEFANLSSTVDGFNVDCEDPEFDFSGAKAVIAGNISACESKTKNASKVLENVVSAHTSLQGSMKFETSAEKAANASNNSSGTRSTGGGYSSTGSYSSSSSYVSSTSGGSALSSALDYVSGPVSGIDPDTVDKSLNLSNDAISSITTRVYLSEGEKTMGIQETMEFFKDQVIQFRLGSVWYAIQGATTRWMCDEASNLIARKYGLGQLPEGAYETKEGLYIPGCTFKLAPLAVKAEEVVGLPAKGSLSVIMEENTAKPELWKFGYSNYSKRGNEPYWGIMEVNNKNATNFTFDNSLTNQITYDANGYAKIDDRYVISCDDYFGRVGDKVQVYTDSGPIECVIGYTTQEDEFRLNFFTNEEFDSSKLNEKVTMTSLKSINNLEYESGGGSKPDPKDYGIANYSKHTHYE